MFRHRRSYELRRKGKESVVDSNSVKSMSNGSKPGVFATENCTVVVAQIGGTATLPCVVRKFNNGVVSIHSAFISLFSFNCGNFINRVGRLMH